MSHPREYEVEVTERSRAGKLPRNRHDAFVHGALWRDEQMREKLRAFLRWLGPDTYDSLQSVRTVAKAIGIDLDES